MSLLCVAVLFRTGDAVDAGSKYLGGLKRSLLIPFLIRLLPFHTPPQIYGIRPKPIMSDNCGLVNS